MKKKVLFFLPRQLKNVYFFPCGTKGKVLKGWGVGAGQLQPYEKVAKVIPRYFLRDIFQKESYFSEKLEF